jgi:phosphatidylinositol alpha 1,6-mannosyltransferase
VDLLRNRTGTCDFRFLIVGDGSEKQWLSEHLWHAEFPGVLSGEPLAHANANMEIFVFPSHTDTFGTVILEAMASGVPAVVTMGGGPKFLVNSGETGFVAGRQRPPGENGSSRSQTCPGPVVGSGI